MTYVLKAKSLDSLEEQIEEVLKSLSSVSKDWEYILNQTVENILKSVYKDGEGNYSATIFFTQVPKYKENYHGMRIREEQTKKKALAR